MTKHLLKIYFILFIALSFLLLVFNPVSAAMQSDSYIIYENVMHTFDGPVISSVSASVSGTQATVSWTTNIAADSFVIYDKDSSFTSSKEQGYSAKTQTSHVVILSGLDENTTYYYRVRSERINGGISTDTTARSFTTGSESATPTPTPASGGGGMLIIDKTDKLPPEIINISVARITSKDAIINWETNEDATSFVEYGFSEQYGATYGHWSTSTLHTVQVKNLQSNSPYHFRVISSDDWGNVGYSKDQVFTTIVGEGEETLPQEETGVEEKKPIAPEFGLDAINFINRLFPSVSLNNLVSINTFEELTSFAATPVLQGEPAVEVGATEVTISWSTDIRANSLIAFAPSSVYKPDANEPYQQISGNSDEQELVHDVTLYGLTPDTTYHFQLRSKGNIGRSARSNDYTFQTSIEELQIISYFTQIVNNETAVFKWVTNKEADSAVRFTPYFGNTLAIDQSKIIQDNAVSVVHKIEITEFVAGTFYEVEVISTDDKGNEASKIFPQFSTTEDDLPPEISHIKADSTVFIDRGDKIQTIISWLTNEPSTSRVYYEEGVHGPSVELTESTNLNTNYTKEHVMVITKFKPGVVYTFRIESIDSGENVTLSKVHTFMTAKKKESIIQIIINILENTFGWVKKII